LQWAGIASGPPDKYTVSAVLDLKGNFGRFACGTMSVAGGNHFTTTFDNKQYQTPELL
jgi:hypothetical protein